MESIYHRFTNVIADHLLPASRLVVAFSGGVDSRILLECAARFAFEQQRQCVVVHVHHGLSDNADLWSQRCIEWCQEKQLSCVVEKVQLELMVGDSVEERARQARYQALAKHLEPGDLLLTGSMPMTKSKPFSLPSSAAAVRKGFQRWPNVRRLRKDFCSAPCCRSHARRLSLPLGS